MVKRIILSLFLLIGLSSLVWAQDNSAYYTNDGDTLIILNELPLNNESMLIKREIILMADSLKTNIDSLYIKEYGVKAITLGRTDSIKVMGSRVTPAVKNLIKNEQYPYKFIYIENIILINNKNELFLGKPKKIKLTFTK